MTIEELKKDLAKDMGYWDLPLSRSQILALVKVLEAAKKVESYSPTFVGMSATNHMLDLIRALRQAKDELNLSW